MPHPDLHAELERLAELLVMEDLKSANTHKTLAEIFATLQAQIGQSRPEATQACARAAKASAVAAQDSAAELEKLLAALRRDLLEGVSSIEYKNFFEKYATEASKAADQQSPPPPPMLDVALLPVECDPELLREFIGEAREHLEASDTHLLTIESDPGHEEALNAVFRAFHTIKGVAALLALEEIQKVAHESENLLDKARKGTIKLAGAAIDVTFEAVDLLKNLVQNVELLQQGKPANKEFKIEALIQKLQRVQQELVSGQVTKKVEAPAVVEKPARATVSAPILTPILTTAATAVAIPTAEPVHAEPEEAIVLEKAHEEPATAPVRTERT